MPLLALSRRECYHAASFRVVVSIFCGSESHPPPTRPTSRGLFAALSRLRAFGLGALFHSWSCGKAGCCQLVRPLAGLRSLRSADFYQGLIKVNVVPRRCARPAVVMREHPLFVPNAGRVSRLRRSLRRTHHPLAPIVRAKPPVAARSLPPLSDSALPSIRGEAQMRPTRPKETFSGTARAWGRRLRHIRPPLCLVWVLCVAARGLRCFGGVNRSAATTRAANEGIGGVAATQPKTCTVPGITPKVKETERLCTGASGRVARLPIPSHAPPPSDRFAHPSIHKCNFIPIRSAEDTETCGYGAGS